MTHHVSYFLTICVYLRSCSGLAAATFYSHRSPIQPPSIKVPLIFPAGFLLFATPHSFWLFRTISILKWSSFCCSVGGMGFQYFGKAPPSTKYFSCAFSSCRSSETVWSYHPTWHGLVSPCARSLLMRFPLFLSDLSLLFSSNSLQVWSIWISCHSSLIWIARFGEYFHTSSSSLADRNICSFFFPIHILTLCYKDT